MKKRLGMMVLLLVSAAMPAMAEQALPGSGAKENAAQASHQGRGKVVAIDRDKLKIKLEHAPIASLNWPGMTMDFAVSRPALLDKLQPGAQVTFTLVREEKTGRWVIDQITRQ